MAKEMGPQHIISLQAENVKRIVAVDIKLDEKNPAGAVIIKGENGAGKSSVLDAIVMALRGGDAMLDKPIRDGKDKAQVVLKTQELIVRRKFTQAGSYLEVTNHEGLTYKSPQQLLESMINTIGFDPMEFAELDHKEQAKRLLTVCPTELDLDKNAAEQKALREQRTFVNRDVKRLQANLSSYPAPDPELPTELVSVTALSEEMTKLLEENRKAELRANQIATAERTLEQIEQQIKKLTQDRDSLTAQLADLRKKASEPVDYASKIEGIRTQIKNAEATNAKIRQAQQRKQVADDLKKVEEKSTDFEKQITALVEAREAALKSVKFPVAGLGIDAEGNVVFNGNPLKQCSSAEQIRVGIALAAAANPKMKVAFIRHGSLLDNKSLKMVIDNAVEHGMQVWIERVDDSSPTAIEITEGSNIGAKDEEPAQAPPAAGKDECEDPPPTPMGALPEGRGKKKKTAGLF